MGSEPRIAREQRWHPLREECVLFTSHRGGRPSIGNTHPPREAVPPSYDTTCALCPGNPRLRGANPPYTGVYWFTKDLPCFSTEASESPPGDALYQTRRARGTAVVVCYCPDQSKTFVDLTDEEPRAGVDLCVERYAVLGGLS